MSAVDFKTVLIGIIILIVIVLILLSHANALGKWAKIPTLKDYLDENPNCKANQGVRCKHCNSSSIRNWGRDSANDKRREFKCNHCGETLYRSAG